MAKTKNIQTNFEGKMLPNSFDSEQAVLYCALNDPEAVLQIVSRLSTNDFYNDTHRKIFDAIKALYNRSENINVLTVSDELERSGDITKIGGMGYITTLSGFLPSTAGLNSFIDIVKRDSILRQIISICNSTLTKAYAKDSSDSLLGEIEKEVFDLAEKGQSSSMEKLGATLPSVIDKFESIHSDPSFLRGLRTGFYGIDKATNGLQKSDLIILAARPGIGKTSLAMNIVSNAAIYSKAKCAVFSFEMSKAQLAQRMLFSVAGVSMANGLSGKLDENDWTKIWKAKHLLSDAEIYIDENSANTPSQILSKCRKLKREKKGLDLVVVDYLGLMKSDGNDAAQGRQVEVQNISRSLKLLAKDLEVPVITICQLNRSVESRDDGKPGRPVLSDLRESGAIEQDADMVWFIHRDTTTPHDINETKDHYTAEIIIAKFRNGQPGSVFVGWDGSRTTFYNLEKDANEQSLVESTERRQEISGFRDRVKKDYDSAMKEIRENLKNEGFLEKDAPDNWTKEELNSVKTLTGTNFQTEPVEADSANAPFEVDEKDAPPEQDSVTDFSSVEVPPSDDPLF